MVEGGRLLQHYPKAKLLISGGVGYDPVPNAEVVADVAVSLGVAADRIVVENRPRDTLEEAELLLPVVQTDPFILVTSAHHMGRAIDIFQSYGMQPIAAPTDYIIKNHLVEPPGALFPTGGNFDLSARILYEWLGSMVKSMTITMKDLLR